MLFLVVFWLGLTLKERESAPESDTRLWSCQIQMSGVQTKKHFVIPFVFVSHSLCDYDKNCRFPPKMTMMVMKLCLSNVALPFSVHFFLSPFPPRSLYSLYSVLLRLNSSSSYSSTTSNARYRRLTSHLIRKTAITWSLLANLIIFTCPLNHYHHSLDDEHHHHHHHRRSEWANESFIILGVLRLNKTL